MVEMKLISFERWQMSRLYNFNMIEWILHLLHVFYMIIWIDIKKWYTSKHNL